MRTNITLEDDVYQLATLYVSARGMTLGAAIGELVRKANTSTSPQANSDRLITAPSGIRIVPPRSKVITSAMVQDALHEDDRD